MILSKRPMPPALAAVFRLEDQRRLDHHPRLRDREAAIASISAAWLAMVAGCTIASAPQCARPRRRSAPAMARSSISAPAPSDVTTLGPNFATIRAFTPPAPAASARARSSSAKQHLRAQFHEPARRRRFAACPVLRSGPRAASRYASPTAAASRTPRRVLAAFTGCAQHGNGQRAHTAGHRRVRSRQANASG